MWSKVTLTAGLPSENLLVIEHARSPSENMPGMKISVAGPPSRNMPAMGTFSAGPASESMSRMGLLPLLGS